MDCCRRLLNILKKDESYEVGEEFRKLVNSCDLKGLSKFIDNGVCVDYCQKGEIWESKTHTPLFLACINQNHDVVKLLLEKNADVNFVNGYGQTPLGEARVKKDRELIDLLLRHGATEKKTKLHL